MQNKKQLQLRVDRSTGDFYLAKRTPTGHAKPIKDLTGQLMQCILEEIEFFAPSGFERYAKIGDKYIRINAVEITQKEYKEFGNDNGNG